MIHLCAAALLVAGLPAVADAYCVRVADKKTIRWNKPPVSYRVSSSLTDKALLTAIDNAFKTWASASCAGLSFKKGSSFKVCTDPKCKEFDNPDGAIFVHWVTGTSTLFKNPTPKGQPYFANFSFTFDKTGGFGGAALAINAKDYNWDAKGGSATKAVFDTWNELVPLIGWAIGVHDSLTKGSVMYGTSSFGDTKRRKLSSDDVNAIRYLYGLCSCKAPPSPDAKCTTKPPGRPACFKTGSGDGGVTPSDAGGTATKDKGAGPGLDAATALEGGSAGNEAGADWYSPSADGGAGTKCKSSSECAADERCTIEGTCVKVGGGEDDGGCGCATGGSQGASGSLLLLLMGLAAALRRRLRRGTFGGTKS